MKCHHPAEQPAAGFYAPQASSTGDPTLWLRLRLMADLPEAEPRAIPTAQRARNGTPFAPVACFAGIWTRWASVRKIKEAETTNDLFAFPTIEPNCEVGAIHLKAMPVILTRPDEIELWMSAPNEEALALQRPLPDASLVIVARGETQDAAPAA